MRKEIPLEDLTPELLTPALQNIILSSMSVNGLNIPSKPRAHPLPTNHTDMYPIWRHHVMNGNEFHDLQDWIDAYRHWYNDCRSTERSQIAKRLKIDTDLSGLLEI